MKILLHGHYPSIGGSNDVAIVLRGAPLRVTEKVGDKKRKEKKNESELREADKVAQEGDGAEPNDAADEFKELQEMPRAVERDQEVVMTSSPKCREVVADADTASAHAGDEGRVFGVVFEVDHDVGAKPAHEPDRPRPPRQEDTF